MVVVSTIFKYVGFIGLFWFIFVTYEITNLLTLTGNTLSAINTTAWVDWNSGLFLFFVSKELIRLLDNKIAKTVNK